MKVSNVNLLKQLEAWLDDNIDQGTDVIFGECEGVEIKSETVLPPLTLAINTLEESVNTYVVVGRVSGNSDILLFIDGTDTEAVKLKFIESVKREHEWDGRSDIYIEFCISLSEYTLNRVYNDYDNHTSSVYSFD